MAHTGPYVEIKDARGVRQSPLLAGPLTIGRNITNLVVLDEPMSSRFHCVIEKTRDGYRVRDMDSRNGILVNGQPVKSANLNHGDVVAIGATELKLVLPAGPARKPRPGASSVSAAELEAADDLASALEPASLDDIVEQPPMRSRATPYTPAAAPAITFTTGPDWERQLRERAESLVPKPFNESDIGVMNSRGQMAHAPLPSGGKPPPGSEAIVLWRLILLICFRSRATDIHVELKQEESQIRIRVDGVMVEILRLYKEQRDLIVRMLSMVKVLCEIDIAQKNIVQEGSFSVRVPSGKPGQPMRRVDYRISFAPAVYGQKLVVRILDTANSPEHISDLQLPPFVVEPVRKMIQQDAGMILVCGPTGSGKTTTLYAILRDIDTTERNVVTIEDPVEIQLDGVTQIPVNEGQGNTFSAMLKSVLRQDPDIILVGEVRDAETARTAMQSAMTGHLVFTTVHARDCVGAVYRLLDLGVESYLVSSALQMVLAQRLVRQLCPHCKVPVKPTSEQAAKLAQYGILNVAVVFNPNGCRRCLNTGFFGRRSVVELLRFNDTLREVVLKTPTMQEIIRSLGPENYLRLADSGFHLVADGSTSFDEADRAVS